MPAEVFIRLQDDAVDDVYYATQTLTDSSTFFDVHGIGTSYRLSSVFQSLTKLGVGLREDQLQFVINDPFLNRAIEFAANHVLRIIKHKARIPVQGLY